MLVSKSAMFGEGPPDFMSQNIQLFMDDLNVESHKEMGTIHAGDFMRRFCCNLCMNHEAVQAAQEAAREFVEKSEEFDIRRSPISIAAAVIYIIVQLSDDKKPSQRYISCHRSFRSNH